MLLLLGETTPVLFLENSVEQENFVTTNGHEYTRIVQEISKLTRWRSPVCVPA